MHRKLAGITQSQSQQMHARIPSRSWALRRTNAGTVKAGPDFGYDIDANATSHVLSGNASCGAPFVFPCLPHKYASCMGVGSSSRAGMHARLPISPICASRHRCRLPTCAPPRSDGARARARDREGAKGCRGKARGVGENARTPRKHQWTLGRIGLGQVWPSERPYVPADCAARFCRTVALSLGTEVPRPALRAADRLTRTIEV